MAIVMTYGGTTFTPIRDPAIKDYSTELQFRDPSMRSGGGALFVYDKGAAKKIVTLTWVNINKTDLINLLAFLTAVDWGSNQFSYTDPRGVAYTAHYYGPGRLDWTPSDQMYDPLTIQLLVVAV